MSKATLTLFLMLLAVLALVLQKPVNAQSPRTDLGASLVVIVSSQTEVRALTLSQVRDIFMGVPTYAAAGEPYVPIAHPARTPLRIAFDEQFLGLDPDASGRFWIDQRIRARSLPPRAIPSLDTLRRVVSALKNAVSYIRADQLAPGLVPIRIDGVDFRSPGYRFHAVSLGTAPDVRAARF